MTEQEVIETVRDHIAAKFPKVCNNCGQRFASLANYLRGTIHVGEPISYDAEKEDWRPKEPLGTVSLANCSCGNTLAIDSEGMGVITMWRLLMWAKRERQKRGVSIRELLTDLRNKIDKSVLEGTEGDR